MGLDDNQKIGVGLICLGICFIFLGILLFLDSVYKFLILDPEFFNLNAILLV
jgi:ABC-type transport system involved in cytochrome bd biosynthesis fused ATPase/permease subunit